MGGMKQLAFSCPRTTTDDAAWPSTFDLTSADAAWPSTFLFSSWLGGSLPGRPARMRSINIFPSLSSPLVGSFRSAQMSFSVATLRPSRLVFGTLDVDPDAAWMSRILCSLTLLSEPTAGAKSRSKHTAASVASDRSSMPAHVASHT